MERAQQRRDFILFVVVAYLLFWGLLGITGWLITMKVPASIQNIMENVCAWVPTFTVLILFKRLYPQTTFVQFLRDRFGTKVKPRIFVSSFVLQVVILGVSVLAYLEYSGHSFQSLKFISLSSIVPVIFVVLTSGPLGEELGWRGYALNALQRKYSPLKAALILGVIWGFWHTPLWFISGYRGISLLYYAIAFMVSIVSTSVIIVFFYNRSRNILSAMWIHFTFDFLLQIVMIDLLHLLIYLAIFYVITAVSLVVFNRREFIVSKAEPNSPSTN